MEDQNVVQVAKGEMEILAPAEAVEATPQSVDEIIAGLKGFGVEELEEVITIQSKGKTARLKITNIPTSDEMLSIQAADDLKGYHWVKRVKAEIISRSISWINGIDLRSLPPEKQFVVDPTDPQKAVKPVQPVLRNLILSWGMEVMEILWKVVMTHAQNIEDRMKNQFPSHMVMTEVEQRLFEQAQTQIDQRNQEIIDESLQELYDLRTSTPEAR